MTVKALLLMMVYSTTCTSSLINIHFAWCSIFIIIHHQISKKDVDNFKPGKCVPKCELIVVWDLEDKKPVRLLYKVRLKGASESCNYFYLNLNPTLNDSMSLTDL